MQSQVLILRVTIDFLHEQEQVTLVIVKQMDVGSSFCIWRRLNSLQVQTIRMALNLCEYILPERPSSCKSGLENLPIWHIQSMSSFTAVQLVIRKYNFQLLRKVKSNNAFELEHENTFFPSLKVWETLLLGCSKHPVSESNISWLSWLDFHL